MDTFYKEIDLSFKFFLNEYPKKIKDKYTIYARLRYNREKAEISMHQDVALEDFDLETQLLKPNKKFNIVKNNLLREKREKIIGLFLKLKDEHKNVTIKMLKDAIKGKQKSTPEQKQKKKAFIDYFINYIEALKSNPQYAPGTVKLYVKTVNHLEKFLKANELSHITVDELNRKFIIDFEEYLLTTPTKSDGTGKPMVGSTSKLYIKKVRSVVNYLMAKEIIKHHPFIGYKPKPFKQPKKVILTNEEIEILKNYEFESDRLRNTAKCFLFCVFTGLRFGDAKQLNTKSIVIDENLTHWIHLENGQEKSSEPLEVPIQDEAMKIYHYFEDYRLITGNILPIASNQQFNKSLKEVMKKCGIRKRVHSHIARHTFASLTLNAGIDIFTVSKLMGHANIRTTQVYTQLLRSKKTEAIKILNNSGSKQLLMNS